ncbi:hypothetical protein N9B41_02045, partial [bacterium]|nr:hypothetical protein [bacterium]
KLQSLFAFTQQSLSFSFASGINCKKTLVEKTDISVKTEQEITVYLDFPICDLFCQCFGD